jgi:DNA/RNA-binding domain of Phe-tRNA-synthetase-like protein
MVAVAPHPLLDARLFRADLAGVAADSPEWLRAGLRLDFAAPMQSDDALRAAVRDLLRHGGFKPTGRSKPASEYLLRAAAEGALNTINPVVDACNVASLHSGLPISVVDLDRTVGALSIAIAPAGANYVFNGAGQTIDVGGLLCLHDGEGPCANAVKDAQRTKTASTTRRVLVVVWGTVAAADRAERVARWYRDLLERLGAFTEPVSTG